MQLARSLLLGTLLLLVGFAGGFKAGEYYTESKSGALQSGPFILIPLSPPKEGEETLEAFEDRADLFGVKDNARIIK